MKKLFDTQLLKLLSAKGTFNPGETDITPMYDDFVLSVISLCTSHKGDIPAYFTLYLLGIGDVPVRTKHRGGGEKMC